MSKGDTRRPEAKPGSYDEGYERTFPKPKPPRKPA